MGKRTSSKDKDEPFEFKLLRQRFPGCEIPKPLLLGKEHLIPALSLLRGGQQGKSAWSGVLATTNSPKFTECKKPAIIETSGHDGDSGGYSQSETYYPVSEELVELLIQEGFVRGTPHWGYTDRNSLLISDGGIEELRSYWEKKRKEEEEKNTKTTSPSATQ